MVINKPGSTNSGIDAGASSAGTSLMDISPVNCPPVSVKAVNAGTSMLTPKAAFSTSVVVVGLTCVVLLISLRGKVNARGSTLLACGIRCSASRNEA